MVDLFIRGYRRGLSEPLHRGRKTVAERVNRKRFARRKASELAKRIKKGMRVPVDKGRLTARYSSSVLIETLLPGRRDRWLLAPRRVGGLQELKVKDFSIIDNPAATMEALYRIAELECVAPGALLHFEDQYCTDIAPFLVLAEMRPSMAPVFRGGRMSTPVQKVIAAVGLDGALQMALNIDDTADVWAFPVRSRRVARNKRVIQTGASQRKEVVADEFCDALDMWLGENDSNIELTPGGRAAFATIITELLDNAERHSSPQEGAELSGNWSCAAFMARRKTPDGRWVYWCHMGFLSVGATIAESLALGPGKTLADVRRYLAKHSDKGFTSEALTTVYALQDGITRIHEAAGNRGGIGFQELLKFVRLLGEQTGSREDARLTVISGNTCIQLKKPYVEGARADPGDATLPRLIWFNEDNDPGKPPSSNHVHHLGRRFAGTVVGISFILDHDYLKANVDDTDQSSRTD